MNLDCHRDEHADLATLIGAASAGDEGAWRSLVELYWRRVYALARSRRLSEELAEEITQSVFVTLAEKLPSQEYEEKGRFESWLFRVAMNRIRDEGRRSARQATPTDPAEMREARLDETASAQDEEPELAQMRSAIAELNESDREIIELRHHAGMSFKGIADLLGEPVGTLLARHHRALRKLREMMESGDPATSGEAGMT